MQLVNKIGKNRGRKKRKEKKNLTLIIVIEKSFIIVIIGICNFKSRIVILQSIQSSKSRLN